MNSSKKKRLYFSSGQSLIEAVIAVGVVTMVLVALVSGVVSSLKNARYSRDNSVAVAYAQEGIEVIRSIRDRGYEEIQQNDTYSLSYNGSIWSLTTPGEVISEKYTRTVVISDGPDAANSKKVIVTLSWKEGSSDREVTLTTILVRLE